MVTRYHVGKVVEAKEILPAGKEVKTVVLLLYYDGNRNGGYHENDIKVTVDKDGALSLSGEDIDGGFIYLYPEQAKLLRDILNKEEQ